MISNMFLFLARGTSRLFGRANLYRFGRWAYMTARNDVPSLISENGEKWVQSCCLMARCNNNNESVVLFDVGANVGNWLCSLFDVAEQLGCLSKLHVHGFEPVPATYEYLLNRIKSDPRTVSVAIKIECSAMSSSQGRTSMFIVGNNFGINTLHQDSTSVYSHSIMIDTNTIDNYIQKNNINRVLLLKCDTEGHDMEVLRGAQGSLRNGLISVIQFEYNHRWVYSRNFLKDVFDLVADLPYDIGKVTPNHVEFYAEWHPELEKYFEANYVIVHHDARQWFLYHNMIFDERNAVRSTQNSG